MSVLGKNIPLSKCNQVLGWEQEFWVRWWTYFISCNKKKVFILRGCSHHAPFETGMFQILVVLKGLIFLVVGIATSSPPFQQSTQNQRKWPRCLPVSHCTLNLPAGSAVQTSGGIQPQPSHFGPDEISAVATAARFTCQYGSRNGSRPLIVRIINIATTICTSSSCSCIIYNSFPICCTGLPAT
jgi:hypothetical protein